MGGFGSGRRNQGGRDTTNNYRALDVRRLLRDGLLIPGRRFSWQWMCNGEEVASIQVRVKADRVILNYRNRSNGGEWQPMEYPVYLEWSGCNLGGRRAWFLCPAGGCGRRVALLYIGTKGVFACRHCHNLAYASQRESPDDRAIRRADTIRRRLGWKAGIVNPAGGKPKGMHWRTFERLKTEHDACAWVTLAGLDRWLQQIKKRRARLFGVRWGAS